jgi:hypothetical protein
MGSGTTLIAVEMSGRMCFGIGMNLAYVDVVGQRWPDFTGVTAQARLGYAIDTPRECGTDCLSPQGVMRGARAEET